MSLHSVFIIDDDAAVRDSLLMLLRGEGIRARGFASGVDFFKNLPEDATACVITDVRMPDMEGDEVVRRLTQLRGAAWPVIVITGHADVPMAVQMMKAGIVDFIEKPDQPQTLASDVMAVGRYVLSADIWPELERTEPGAWDRIQLTDAIAALNKTHPVEAMLMTGESYDCGKKMGYMKAFVNYGLRNLKEGQKFRESIKKMLS